MEGGIWEWKWSWRREPRRREFGELEELKELLEGVSVDRGRKDKVGWTLDP